MNSPKLTNTFDAAAGLIAATAMITIVFPPARAAAIAASAVWRAGWAVGIAGAAASDLYKAYRQRQQNLSDELNALREEVAVAEAAQEGGVTA